MADMNALRARLRQATRNYNLVAKDMVNMTAVSDTIAAMLTKRVVDWEQINPDYYAAAAMQMQKRGYLKVGAVLRALHRLAQAGSFDAVKIAALNRVLLRYIKSEIGVAKETRLEERNEALRLLNEATADSMYQRSFSR